jgi:hypothetical protein
MKASSVWVNNSTYIGNTATATSSTIISFITGFIGLAILAHSYYIHRKKIDGIRLCTDIAAATAALGGLFTYLSLGRDVSNERIIILNNLFINGLLSMIIQLSDSYMFYSRMLAVRPKMRAFEKILIFLYVWIVLVLTWIPTYTFVPFFYDTNSDHYLDVYEVLNTIYTMGVLVYNFYFTLQCLLVLNRVSYRMKAASQTPGSNTSQLQSAIPTFSNSVSDASTADRTLTSSHSSLRVIRIIAIKSIGHAVTSSFAALFYAYGGQTGFDMWTFSIIIGMHLWFNVRMEGYLCPEQVTAKIKTRSERERDVIQKNRRDRRIQAEGGLLSPENIRSPSPVTPVP